MPPFPIPLFSLDPCLPPFLRSSCSIKFRFPHDRRKDSTSDDEEQKETPPGICPRVRETSVRNRSQPAAFFASFSTMLFGTALYSLGSIEYPARPWLIERRSVV